MVRRAQLVITDRNGALMSFDLPDGGAILGSDADADISIGSDLVSRRHARLHWDGRQLSVIDLGSSEGTAVNGSTIVDWVDLTDGDMVRFGLADGRVVVSDSDSAAADSPGIPNDPSETRLRHRRALLVASPEDRPVVEVVLGYLRERSWRIQLVLTHDADAIRADFSNVEVALTVSSTSGSAIQRAVARLAGSVELPVVDVVVGGAGVTGHLAADRGSPRHVALDYSPLAGDLGLGELEEIAWVMDRLARGLQLDVQRSALHRVAVLAVAVGVLGTMVTMLWLIFRFPDVATATVAMLDGISGDLVPDSTPTVDASGVWRADAFVLPALIASLAALAAGLGLRGLAARRIYGG
jgi:hypothetical protein